MLGLQQSSTWGWDSVATWACIVGGLAVLVVFVLVELRTPVPLIKVKIFRDRAFLADNAVLFFSMMAFVPVFFFASIYSQLSLGLSANDAGLYLWIYFAGFAVASQIGGRILDARGAKPTVIFGCVVGAAGYALWGWKLTDLTVGGQWPYIVLAGAGIGFLLGPASTDAVNRTIDASYGEVTGITQTLRNYGSSLGLAVLGTLLIRVNTDKVTSTLTQLGVPADRAQQLAGSLSSRGGGGDAGQAGLAALPSGAREQVLGAIKLDFAQASQWVFYGMALTLVISLVFALAHPGGRVTQERTSASVGGMAPPGAGP